MNTCYTLMLCLFSCSLASAVLVGGWKPLTNQDLASRDLRQIVVPAVEIRVNNLKRNKANKNLYLARQISGTKRVVQGMLYKLKLKMVLTTCLKGNDLERQITSTSRRIACHDSSSGTQQTCEVDVWSRPFLPDPEDALKITKPECK